MNVITSAKPCGHQFVLKNTKSLQKVQDGPLNGCSVLSTLCLLLVNLFPTIGHTKTGRNSPPWDFSSSKNTMLRFMIYVKNIENSHCINKKKNGIPALSRKKGPAILFHTRNTSQKKKKPSAAQLVHFRDCAHGQSMGVVHRLGVSILFTTVEKSTLETITLANSFFQLLSCLSS